MREKNIGHCANGCSDRRIDRFGLPDNRTCRVADEHRRLERSGGKSPGFA